MNFEKMKFEEINEIFKKYRETIFSDKKYYSEENEIKLIIDIKSFIWTFSFYEKLLKSKINFEIISKKMNIESKRKFNKNYWTHIKNILRDILKTPYEIESQDISIKKLEYYINLRNNLIHDCNFELDKNHYSKIENFEKYHTFFQKITKLIKKKFKILI